MMTSLVLRNFLLQILCFYLDLDINRFLILVKTKYFAVRWPRTFFWVLKYFFNLLNITSMVSLSQRLFYELSLGENEGL